MSFLQNREVCFNQESLPITYHNFRQGQGSQPISYKVNFSQRDKMHLADHKKEKTYQNIWEKTKVRALFTP